MYIHTHQIQVSSQHVLSCFISIYIVYTMHIPDIHLYMQLIQHLTLVVFNVSWHALPTHAAVSWHRGQSARSTGWSWFWSPLYTGSVGQIHVQYVCWPWWTGKICICTSQWGSTSMDMPIIYYVNVVYIKCVYTVYTD
jgi:hypothetical protein